jgi:hypothetical protein
MVGPPWPASRASRAVSPLYVHDQNVVWKNQGHGLGRSDRRATAGPRPGSLFLAGGSRYDELVGASGLVEGRCWGMARSWPSPRPVTIGTAADSDAAIRGPGRVDATPAPGGPVRCHPVVRRPRRGRRPATAEIQPSVVPVCLDRNSPAQLILTDGAAALAVPSRERVLVGAGRRDMA